MLSALVFIPLLFIPFLFILRGGVGRYVALFCAFLQSFVYLWITINANFSSAQILTEKHEWIEVALGKNYGLKLYYWLQLDGLNYLLTGLTIFIFLIAVLASWKVTDRTRAYFSLLLLLQTALMGAFLSSDLFLFYIFYEFMLAPMYFLIGIWGGEKRQFAATKFFLYTLVGSLFLLIVMIALGLGTAEFPQGPHTLAFANLSDALYRTPDSLFNDYFYREIAFWFLFIGFAVKLPIVPLHTWLPDAHVEASTPISVLLAGILLKVGGYGIIRMACGFFPDIYLQNIENLAIIALFSILYGGFVALAQADFKRMIAYSSVAHMGFVLLGVASAQASGISGAVYQMFTHGITAAMLFLVVGYIYERIHDRNIEHFSGLWNLTPNFTFFSIFAFMAGLALPGLSTFISEFMVFWGGISNPNIRTASMVAVLGVFISAAYFLRAFKKIFLGEVYLIGGDVWREKLTDVKAREWIIFTLLGTLILIGGIFPSLFINTFEGWLLVFLDKLNK